MVLLPNSEEEVLSGAKLSSTTSTELASEGTPSKVFIAASSSSSTTTPPSSVVVPASVSLGVPSANASITTTTTPSNTTTATPSNTTTATATSMAMITTALTISDDVTEPTVGASAGPLSPYRPSRVELGSLNACITCYLCKGYLIDATTIVECLHSFCHSCIIKHLHTEQYCPQCEVMINKAKPNIKPDVPLQSIVFKLVPELYENELRRRRDFYRDHPEAVAFTTPAQRGEDTEHLIFSPNEQISLSLEYAESELAEDNKELLRPRFLLCPAVFSIAMMKKFLVNKYGISERQFCVEIMYKVKTIVLPDYYTLMDVAYIYTWKRDAPMKYFYRIRTTETNPLELPEIPLRRSPSLIASDIAKQQQQQQQKEQQQQQQSRPSRDEDEEDDKENQHLAPLHPLAVAAVSSNAASPTTASITTVNKNQQTDALAAGRKTTITAPGTPDVNGNRKTMPTAGTDAQSQQQQQSSPGSAATGTTVVARKNESIKLKIELNKNKYVSFLQSPQSDVASAASSAPVTTGPAVAADESASPGGAGGRAHKSDRPDKVKRKKSESPRTHKIHEKMRELKIRIEKIRGEGLMGVMKNVHGPKSNKKLEPHKVQLCEYLPETKRFQRTSPGGGAGSGKASKSKSLKTHASPPEGTKHPIVLKIDQRSPDMAISTLKFDVTPRESKLAKTPSPPPFPPLPPSPPVKRFEDEKSQFLNSIQLAPIKTEAPEVKPNKPAAAEPAATIVSAAISPSPGSTPPTTTTAVVTSSPPKSPPGEVEAGFKKPLPTLNLNSRSPSSSQSSPPRESNGGSLKRKSKDSASSLRSGPKKPKLSDDELKAMVEKKVAETKLPSENIVAPIFLKPKVPPPTSGGAVNNSGSKRQLSPPLAATILMKDPSKAASSDKSAKSSSWDTGRTIPPKCDSPRPFVFKTPPPPPPPIVSVTNIPAVKPSQQVLPAPLPQKISDKLQTAAAVVPIAPAKSSQPSPPPPPKSPSSAATGGASLPKNSNNGSVKASALTSALARRPTVPTKLPTSNAVVSSGKNTAASNSVPTSNATTHTVPSTAGGKFQKPLELKRAQSNPWFNMTEISRLGPDDFKKNVKVYGPTAQTTDSTTTSTSISTSTSTTTTTTSSTTTPTTETSAMPKLDTVSFAVPKKPAPKQQQQQQHQSAASSAVSSGSATPTTKTPPVSGAGGASAGGKVRPVNYLNYALFNSKAAPAGSRTPIPSYSVSSPSYSPDSPQYNPNLNISTKQFKYANPAAFSNYMQNMMSDRKPGSVSPPSPASSPSPPQADLPAPKKVSPPPPPASASDRKRPASALSPDTTTAAKSPPLGGGEPLEKQPKVQSLLKKINIPSSLSITLASEEDEVARQTARMLSENDPTNNYIEIVKLPEIPITEVLLSGVNSVVVSSNDRKTPPAIVPLVPSKPTMATPAGVGGVAARTPSPPGSAAMQVLQVRSDEADTTSTSTSISTSTTTTPSSAPPSSSSTPKSFANGGDVESGYQLKFEHTIQAKSKISSGKGSSGNTSAAPSSASKSTGKSSSSPAVSRPGTSKATTTTTSSTSSAAAKFKHPNATVLDNGKVKLHNFPDVDLLVKGFNSAGASPQQQRTSASSSDGASSAKMMPPPPSKNLSLTSSSSSTVAGLQQRKAISPPVMRSPSSPSMLANGGGQQPKSKTPPSNLPSMASMGPMFGIQMKSDANAAAASGGGIPLRRNSIAHMPTSSSSYPTSQTTPRRKITPTNNSTSLVPLRSSMGGASVPSSPLSAASQSPSSSSPSASAVNDFITLHPQPSPMEQQQQQQQLSQLQNMMLANQYAMMASLNRNPAAAAAAVANKFYPYFLQQFTHQQQRHAGVPAIASPPGMGSADSLTITASPRPSPKQQSMSLNSLTVTAIRSPNGGGSSPGSSIGKGGPGGGGGGGGGIGLGPTGQSRGLGGAAGGGNRPGSAS